MDDQRRFILAMTLSGLVFMVYYFFFVLPTQEAARADAELEMARAQAERARIEAQAAPAAPAPTVEQLLAAGERIKIDAPGIRGSLSTTGARVDDVTLNNYDETLDPADGQVQLIRPAGGTERSGLVADNWVLPGQDGATPLGLQTEWSVVSGDVLTPTTPVTLQTTVGGVEITRTLKVDDHFLITTDDVLSNTGAQPVTLVRRGVSRQMGLPDDLTNFFIIQEGPISVLDDSYHDEKYKKTTKEKWTDTGEAGWTGLTDKYWLQAAIAPQQGQITVEFDHNLINGIDTWDAVYTTAPMTITPGASVTSTGYLYAGAKDRGVLEAYEDAGITGMSRAIDWGAMGLLVRPIMWALSRLGELLGNYGLGILALTLIIKLLMFPLFNKQYASQAKMKKVMPEVKKLQERYKDDRVKQQQEMMALYKKEGVNPAAGCLPIIPTIFVFFSLYKAVFIDIDLRHEPFIGYIQDLSAREPVSILNGFGLLPWDAVPAGLPAFIAIGPLGILYGVTMSLMYTLTPPSGDPTQAKIFKFMPWIFMFILAAFPAGLLIYWVWNNILSFFQQWYITKKNGVDTPVDAFLRKITGRPDPVDIVE